MLGIKGEAIIEEEGQRFQLQVGPGLGLNTSNDDTLKVAQKQGFVVVVRKDPKLGHIRIKCRPDVDLDLRAAAEEISKLDRVGSWFYHPGGKMLINGSRKHRHQTPSPLSLMEVIAILRKLYG